MFPEHLPYQVNDIRSDDSNAKQVTNVNGLSHCLASLQGGKGTDVTNDKMGEVCARLCKPRSAVISLAWRMLLAQL